MFTVGNTRADASQGQPTGDAMRQRTMEKVDTYAFVGVVMAVIWFLWWVFTRVT